MALMLFRSILFLILLAAFQSLKAAPLTETYGKFDCFFMNAGDSYSFEGQDFTSTMDWDTDEHLGAFSRALEMWSSTITATPYRNVKVAFTWADLGSSTLGSATSRYYNIIGQDDFIFTSAEYIWNFGGTGLDMGDNEFDIMIQFSTQFPFSFSENSIIFGQTDFQSVLAHEIGHSLGFSSACGPDGWNGVYTSWDLLLNDGNGLYADDPLFDYATGKDIYIGDTGLRAYNPATYQPGSSMSHIDAATDPDALMQYSIPANTFRRELSDREKLLMAEMGWSIIPEPASALLLAAGIAAMSWRRPRRKAA